MALRSRVWPRSASSQQRTVIDHRRHPILLSWMRSQISTTIRVDNDREQQRAMRALLLFSSSDCTTSR
jgi:hypothetical protein